MHQLFRICFGFVLSAATNAWANYKRLADPFHWIFANQFVWRTNEHVWTLGVNGAASIHPCEMEYQRHLICAYATMDKWTHRLSHTYANEILSIETLDDNVPQCWKFSFLHDAPDYYFMISCQKCMANPNGFSTSTKRQRNWCRGSLPVFIIRFKNAGMKPH